MFLLRKKAILKSNSELSEYVAEIKKEKAMDEAKKVVFGGDSDNGLVLLQKILQLPNKILRHHDVEDLSPMVLHDLGHDAHFSLQKAVYLVNNPDFDCLKGVAGFDHHECELHKHDVWDEPHCFCHDMKNADFHNKVKEFSQNKCVGNMCIDTHNPDDLLELAEKLGLKNPSFITWGMRHSNQGILLFEDHQPAVARKKELLVNAAPLLSLC
ncbi:MAG: hypothetical protein US69_C0007G0056 [candidate division TM6 bacterium GW2011_GWF2_38_10]|nr:MAG: hypothetical protein US69_C0007G0056 [candidate division TM6 bacterium GW2011_GWF2_38_10]